MCHGVWVDEDLWDAYDKMGLSFQQHAADSAYNAHYDRPAVLAALGSVTGLQVLDAACGPGLYLRELLERGAEVSAFDASPVMVNLARRQTAGRVRIDQAVLGEPLPYPDGVFDLIVCALGIHYASDRAAAFAEFGRVLRVGGAVVVSTQHPVMDWLRKGGSYFQTTPAKRMPWRSWQPTRQATTRSWRRLPGADRSDSTSSCCLAPGHQITAIIQSSETSSAKGPPQPFRAVPHLPYSDHSAHDDHLVVPRAPVAACPAPG